MGSLGMEVRNETSDLPPDFKYKESKKFIEDLTENDKGQWTELSDDELKNQMSGLMGYMYDKEVDTADWVALDFKTYGFVSYKETFPGFDPSVYQILEDSTKDENKVINTRPPPLIITHEESTLKFDYFCK